MKSTTRAFTLIELLVVIAIISLLISLLLPALGEVKKIARGTVCSAGQRQLAVGVASYGNDSKESIPGSPTTSGAEALAGRFNGVAIQTYDWMGPLAAQMGIGPTEVAASNGGDDEQARSARFEWYRNFKGFTCAANSITAVPWNANAQVWQTGRMISYNMSTQFTSTEAPSSEGGTGDRRGEGIDRRGYRPFLHRVGTPSVKVAIYEGHRYFNASLEGGPDFDPAITASFGGAFGDTGPWYDENNSLDRRMAPGERLARFVTTLPDARRFAFRHGGTPKQSTGASNVAVKGYLAFFDGHVAIYDDVQATNPDFWFPTGTIIGGNGRRLRTWNATAAAFPEKCGANGPYQVP